MRRVWICEDGHETPAESVNAIGTWRTRVCGSIMTSFGPLVCDSKEWLVTRHCPDESAGTRACGLIAWLATRPGSALAVIR